MTKIYLLGNSTRIQMFGCVICSDDKTVVIDGGTTGDYTQLADIIKEKGRGFVDGWFFTHPHHDHIGAFVELIRNNPEIRIEKIFYNFPDIEILKKYGSRRDDELRLWTEFIELKNKYFENKVQCVESDDVFSFDGIEVSVLRVYNPEITSDFVNNSSAVYRIDSMGKSILILGDLGEEGGEELMKNCSFEKLHTDYTQLAHHGQGGVNEEFYKYIKPQRCIWASPEWLWNNDNGNGFDSGPWKTVETRNWMKKLGVKEHFVEKDGTIEIEFAKQTQ